MKDALFFPYLFNIKSSRGCIFNYISEYRKGTRSSNDCKCSSAEYIVSEFKNGKSTDRLQISRNCTDDGTIQDSIVIYNIFPEISITINEIRINFQSS